MFLMSSPRLRSALAVAFLAACPAFAADPAPVAAATPMPTLEAIQAVLGELQAGADPAMPLPWQLERIAAVRLSPATRDKLRAEFGTDHLFALERRPSAAGKLAYRASLFPVHVERPGGITFGWTGGRLDVGVNRAGSAYNLHGGIERVSGDSPYSSLTLGGLTLDATQKRGFAGLWFGSMQGRIGKFGIRNKNEGTEIAISDIGFASRVTEKPKTIDVAYENRIGSIALAGQHVDDLRLALRVRGIGKQAVADLKTATDKLQKQQGGQDALAAMTPQQRAEVFAPVLRTFGEALLARGTVIEVDEVSASYHGNKAALKGRVALPGATLADFSDTRRLAGKVMARFDVRVPLALVREIAGMVADKEARDKAALLRGIDDPQVTAQLNKLAETRRTMAQAMITELVKQGLMRIENDVLVSTLEWKNGALTANGKPVGTPRPRSTADEPEAAAAAADAAVDAAAAAQDRASARPDAIPEERSTGVRAGQR